MNDQQRELIDLLRNEVAALVEVGCDQIPEDGELTAAVVDEQLQQYHERAESIGGAAQLVGLTGLSNACALLANNFEKLIKRQTTLTEEEHLLLESWAFYLLAYLQYIDSEEHLSHTIEGLIVFLKDTAWPHPCDEDLGVTLTNELLLSDVVVLDSDSTDLPVTADAGMISLSLDEDLKPELLEGLLIELPEQAEQFSTALQQYLHDRDQQQLRKAMRVAHTVKGAANVVNVPGIANLMHASEDILESLEKHDVAPPKPLLLLLLETADCLESMVEVLTEYAAPPLEAMRVMQQLLHWIHTINDQGVPNKEQCLALPWLESVNELPGRYDIGDISADLDDSNEGQALNALLSGLEEQGSLSSSIESIPQDVSSSISAHSGLKIPEIDTAEQLQPEVVPQETVRVVSKQLDDLLSLAGESSIASTLQGSQLERMQRHLMLTANYQQRIRQMADELQQLIEVKGVINRSKIHYSQQLNARGDVIPGDVMDPLELEHYNELHSFSNRLQEVVVDAREELQRAQDDVLQLKNIDQEQRNRNRTNQDILLGTRMVVFSTLASRLQRCVRQASRALNKKVTLTIEGEQALLDQNMLQNISDPLMHLLRNAVDHGIEQEEYRLSQEKTAEGNIVLSVKRVADSIEIRCRDDGAGIDRAAVVAMAIERGLLTDEEAEEVVSQDKIEQLILQPGFSTRITASQLSGRGVGLDAVYSQVRYMHGTMSMESELGEGTLFTLRLPMSLHTGHVLLANVHGKTMALLASGVEQIIHLDDKDREQLIMSPDESGAELASYQWGGEAVGLHSLSQLITAVADTDSQELFSVLLLLKESAGSRSGVLLNDLSDCQELVIKPFNDYTYRPPGIVGGAVLGDGSIAPVIDLANLLEADLLPSDSIFEGHSDPVEQPMALVVDDSLSVRRSLKQLVSDMGLDVRTAKDGFEAIGVIDEQVPAVMLVDLEMPRMNGLELTAHLRAREATQNIPVIMITSRTTDKHRRLAKEAGVNTFLTKPFSDDDLSQTIQQEIVC